MPNGKVRLGGEGGGSFLPIRYRGIPDPVQNRANSEGLSEEFIFPCYSIVNINAYSFRRFSVKKEV